MSSLSECGVALVTGGAQRIGRALALAAARAGYDVAISYRGGAEAAEATCAEIEATGVRAAALQADLGSPSAIEALIEAASAFGALRLLVNNASLFEDDRIETLTAQGWDAHHAANLRAPILLTQAFARALPATGEGLVVNICDQRVWKPTPQFFSYSLSKAGLWDATRMLAQALAPRIRVNAIGPGPTLASIHQSPEDFAAESAAVPLGHGGSPEEIGAALAYLIDAPSVTGQMIAVDGGQHLAWRTPDIIGD